MWWDGHNWHSLMETHSIALPKNGTVLHRLRGIKETLDPQNRNPQVKRTWMRARLIVLVVLNRKRHYNSSAVVVLRASPFSGRNEKEESILTYASQR